MPCIGLLCFLCGFQSRFMIGLHCTHWPCLLPMCLPAVFGHRAAAAGAAAGSPLLSRRRGPAAHLRAAAWPAPAAVVSSAGCCGRPQPAFAVRHPVACGHPSRAAAVNAGCGTRGPQPARAHWSGGAADTAARRLCCSQPAAASQQRRSRHWWAAATWGQYGPASLPSRLHCCTGVAGSVIDAGCTAAAAAALGPSPAAAATSAAACAVAAAAACQPAGDGRYALPSTASAGAAACRDTAGLVSSGAHAAGAGFWHRQRCPSCSRSAASAATTAAAAGFADAAWGAFSHQWHDNPRGSRAPAAAATAAGGGRHERGGAGAGGGIPGRCLHPEPAVLGGCIGHPRPPLAASLPRCSRHASAAAILWRQSCSGSSTTGTTGHGAQRRFCGAGACGCSGSSCGGAAASGAGASWQRDAGLGNTTSSGAEPAPPAAGAAIGGAGQRQWRPRRWRRQRLSAAPLAINRSAAARG